MYEKQMKLFEEGGLYEEGGMIDEQSGNEVPAGSTREEVRDDIPARLSEGEFVFPADVVRYIGLDNLMKMRQKAKRGLMTMEEMGQMGNSDTATIPDDVPMEEAVNMGNEPLEFQQGGVVQMGSPIGGGGGGTGGLPLLSYQTYVNAEGNTIVIPILNGVPIYPVPQGYYKQGEAPTEKPTEEPKTTKVDTAQVMEQDNDNDRSDESTAPQGWSSFTTPEALAAEVEKFNSPAYAVMTAGLNAALGPIGSVLSASNVNGGIKAIDDMLSNTSITSQQRKLLNDARVTLENKKSTGIVGRIADTISNIGKEDLSGGPTSPAVRPPPRPPELTRPSSGLDLGKMQEDIEDIKSTISGGAREPVPYDSPEYLDLNLNPPKPSEPPPARPKSLTRPTAGAREPAPYDSDIEYLDLNLDPPEPSKPPPARPESLTRPSSTSPASYQSSGFTNPPTYSDDNDSYDPSDFSYDPGAYTGIPTEEQLWNKGGFVKRKNKPVKKA